MPAKPQIGVFWALFAATTIVYAVMVFWSLPKINAAADGQMPFDLRPFGYSVDEARRFLGVLSDEGRAFYRGTQHRLDTLYPALLAATLGLGIWIMSPGRSPWIRGSLAVLAIPGMVFDLTENALVAGLLELPAASADAKSVMIASAATTMKSIFTTIAMGLLLVFTSHWAWRKWRR
jgi:hypothetical protein